jgi:hypothetical protein
MDGAPVWTQLGTSPRGREVNNREQRLSEGSKVFAIMGSWAGNGKPECMVRRFVASRKMKLTGWSAQMYSALVGAQGSRP